MSKKYLESSDDGVESMDSSRYTPDSSLNLVSDQNKDTRRVLFLSWLCS